MRRQIDDFFVTVVLLPTRIRHLTSTPGAVMRCSTLGQGAQYGARSVGP